MNYEKNLWICHVLGCRRNGYHAVFGKYLACGIDHLPFAGPGIPSVLRIAKAYLKTIQHLGNPDLRDQVLDFIFMPVFHSALRTTGFPVHRLLFSAPADLLPAVCPWM